MSEQSKNGPGFTGGLVTGAMVGAGLALLFAPKAGARLREQIGESVEAARNGLTTRGRAIAAGAGEALHHVKGSPGATEPAAGVEAAVGPDSLEEER